MTIRPLWLVGQGQLAGRVWRSTTPVCIGRTHDEQPGVLLIRLSEMFVTRRHARVEPTPPGWRLRDLNSLNGTYLNGRLLAADDAELKPGDVISIANARSSLLVQFGEPTAFAPEPQDAATAADTGDWPPSPRRCVHSSDLDARVTFPDRRLAMTADDWRTCDNPLLMVAELLARGASDRKLRLFICAYCRRCFWNQMPAAARAATATAEEYADGRADVTQLRAAGGAIAFDSADPPRVGDPGVSAPGADPYLSEIDAEGYADDLDIAESINPMALARAASGWDLFTVDEWYNPPEPTTMAARAAALWATHEWPPIAAGQLFAAESLTRPSWVARQRAAYLLREIFGNPLRPASADPAWLAWNDRTVVKVARAIYDGRTFADLPVLADALEDAGCNDAELLAHCRGHAVHVRGCWALDLLLGNGRHGVEEFAE
jgi:hypothetical protein